MEKKIYHTEQADGSMLVDFKDRPLKIDGTQVKSLIMREPTVDDQLVGKQISSDPAEAEIAILANLTELPPEQVRKFTMRQYGRLQDAYADFFA